MTDEQAARLRELAGKATPGPWEARWGHRHLHVKTARGTVVLDTRNPPMSEHTARYIAAASPDVLLALLDERDSLRRERDEARNEGFAWSQAALKAGGEKNAAMALLRQCRNLLALMEPPRLPVAEWRRDITENIDALLGGVRDEATP